MLLVAAALFLAQSDAVVKGVVSFGGVMPTVAKKKAEGDPFCAGTPFPLPIVIGKDRGLADVLVRLRRAPGGRSSLRDAMLEEDVTLTWEKCALSPRVIGLLSGQTLVVENRDDTLHSLVATVGTAKLFSRALPPKAKAELVPEAPPGEILELRCEVHIHEVSTILVQQHPYFTVTKDDGAFELDFVPAGGHVVEAYHPKLGWKHKGVGIADGKVHPSPLYLEFRAADAVKN